jgi:hypothetical protein
MPPARSHIIYRATERPGPVPGETEIVSGYQVPDFEHPLEEAPFEFWLARQGLAGEQRLFVSVLVIREELDASGLIVRGSIERRRGSAEGPLYGDPARVEFTGAAETVRVFKVAESGHLRESAPKVDVAPPPSTGRDPFPGELDALRARYGRMVAVEDAREPGPVEALLGVSVIFHLNPFSLGNAASETTPSARSVALGWHGPVPFLLEAAFARLGAPTLLDDRHIRAVADAARAAQLTPYEGREDARGIAVVARDEGDGFALLRLADGAAVAEPYDPHAGIAEANADQQVWLRYAERHERRTVLEAYRTSPEGDIAVISADEAGEVTHHAIDAEGIELWRRGANHTAVAAHHRERLFPSERLAARELAQQERLRRRE